MKFRITSTRGADYGIFEGETDTAALLAMHRDAGYGPDRVWIDADGELAFADDELRGMCGGVDDWTIEEVEDVTCPRCGDVNKLAHEDGAVDGPREYHAACWTAMSAEEQKAAWEDRDE